MVHCTLLHLNLGAQLVCVLKFSCVFFHHLNWPSVQSGRNFPLAATSREVGYSPIDLSNIYNSDRRNIKLCGDRHVAFTLTIHNIYVPPYLLKQYSFLMSMFSGA